MFSMNSAQRKTVLMRDAHFFQHVLKIHKVLVGLGGDGGFIDNVDAVWFWCHIRIHSFQGQGFVAESHAVIVVSG